MSRTAWHKGVAYLAGPTGVSFAHVQMRVWPRGAKIWGLT